MTNTPRPLRFREETAPGNYTGLSYVQRGPGLWRIVVWETGCNPADVGPHYRTKAELLADAERYAREYGFRD